MAARRRTLVTLTFGSSQQRSLYAAADVFVSPSRAEGMPFSILEALASSVPVVASDLPGQAAIAARARRLPDRPR